MYALVNKKNKGKSRKSKRTRGGVGNGTGIYSFSEDKELYFFSDLEGNMPDGIKKLMFDENEENDIPVSLDKKVIVFTGDLIDRGEYSIRNLQRMLALKYANHDNVILICGNRDVNKIRMYHECHIKEIEDKILNDKVDVKDKGIDAILDILQGIEEVSSIFTNKLKAIKDIIDIKGINGTGDDRPIFTEKYSDDISRITNMYSNTLGSPKQIELFKAEFKFLFGINEDFWKDKGNTLLLKFIAMMNMVMGKVWDERALPAVLVPYNGLYIKYLQECHIMASITIGTKLCIVSHAGIPYDERQGFYIPTEIGKISTEPVDYTNNIKSLNKGFSAFIESIKGGNITTNIKEYKRYVAMSANCDDKVAPYTAYASPIVSQKDFDEVKSKKGFDLDVFRKKETHIYNIYGHQPSGLLPYISRVITNKSQTIDETFSYHIDLDISKAEDNIISNKETYVYLRITKDTDMLFGKTVSKKTYHSITKEKSQQSTVKETKEELENKTVIEPSIRDLDELSNKIVNDTDEDAKIAIIINYEVNGVKLFTYCNNILQATYTTQVQSKQQTDTFTSTIFTVDNNKYYGMFSWTLVEYTKKAFGGGRGKIKIYTKSIKRFMYGKRKMVIYVGKRGGEYVKVKGEYVSLAKFRLKKV
jgi:hypothetical protein